MQGFADAGRVLQRLLLLLGIVASTAGTRRRRHVQGQAMSAIGFVRVQGRSTGSNELQSAFGILGRLGRQTSGHFAQAKEHAKDEFALFRQQLWIGRFRRRVLDEAFGEERLALAIKNV